LYCFADDDAGAGSSSSDTCHLGATAAQPTTPEQQQQQGTPQCCVRCLPLQQGSVLLSAAFLLAGKPSLTARQLAQACQQLRPVAAAAVGTADAAVGSSATAAAWCEQDVQQQQQQQQPQHVRHVEMLEKVHKRRIATQQDVQQKSDQPARLPAAAAAAAAAATAVDPTEDDAPVLSVLPQPLVLHDMLGQMMRPNTAAAAAAAAAARPSAIAADVANLLHLLGSADLSSAESAVTACLQGQQQLLQQQQGVPVCDTALTGNSSSSNVAGGGSSCLVCGWRPVFGRVADAEGLAGGDAWVMLPSSASSGTGKRHSTECKIISPGGVAFVVYELTEDRDEKQGIWHMVDCISRGYGWMGCLGDATICCCIGHRELAGVARSESNALWNSDVWV
jgi:hypothetical protein